jgi:hypothetical protein
VRGFGGEATIVERIVVRVQLCNDPVRTFVLYVYNGRGMVSTRYYYRFVLRERRRPIVQGTIVLLSTSSSVGSRWDFTIGQGTQNILYFGCWMTSRRINR